MALTPELSSLMENLKSERDEILLKLHLGSMEVKEEFDTLESKWDMVLQSCAELSDQTIDASAEVLLKAKSVGQETKDSYQRILRILSE